MKDPILEESRPWKTDFDILGFFRLPGPRACQGLSAKARASKYDTPSKLGVSGCSQKTNEGLWADLLVFHRLQHDQKPLTGSLDCNSHSLAGIWSASAVFGEFDFLGPWQMKADVFVLEAVTTILILTHAIFNDHFRGGRCCVAQQVQ